jgi:dCTP deaminase|nr:MAG TPA_asm: dCTP deaminase dUTPase [Caudoviricetes sp.]
MILSDHWIKQQHEMIVPFVDHTVRSDENGNRVCSYGLSSAGYDLRLSEQVLYKEPQNGIEYDDPKNGKLKAVQLEIKEDESGRYVMMQPGAAWASSVEWVNMPRDAVALLQPKSSYARCGISIINPLIEPGWCGNMTISILNGSNKPVKLYINEGFAQMVFYKVEDVEISYSERGGLYQATSGVAFANV